MDINPYVVLGSAVVGLLVGLTGAGGGALMTPMLILLFNVKPAAAISSDLVAAVVMRPVGSLVHMHRGTVNYRLVGWMCAGSVPMAFLGAYLLHLLGANSGQQGAASQQNVEIALGAALLAGTAAMVLRSWLDHRSGQARTQSVAAVRVKPAATIAIGAVGGLVVGMTSVGSGSLMIVLLLFTYPVLAAGQLVGTDLTQAVPLTAAAALGALLFGHVQFGLTTAVIIGSVPAVLIGSFLSSRAPDKYIRPVITFVIFASGLKYAGLGTQALGWVLCLVLLACGGYWLARNKPWLGHGAPGDTAAQAASKAVPQAAGDAAAQAASGAAAQAASEAATLADGPATGQGAGGGARKAGSRPAGAARRRVPDMLGR